MTLGQSDSPVSVATFTYGVASATASYFAAQISWGDGTTSTGTVSGSAGQFSVKANHSYAQPGSYTVGTTINDAAGSSPTPSRPRPWACARGKSTMPCSRYRFPTR